MKNRLFNLTRLHAPASTGKSGQPDDLPAVSTGVTGASQTAGARPLNGREADRASRGNYQPDPQPLNSEMQSEKRQDDGAAARDAAAPPIEACRADCTADHNHHHKRPELEGKPNFFSLCTKCANDGKVRTDAFFPTRLSLHIRCETKAFGL